MGWSLSPSVYVDLLYSDRRSVAVCHRSPTVVAISGANGVLIVFSIVMAAGQNQIKVPSLLLLLLPFALPGRISSPFSIFSVPHGSALPVPPPSSSLLSLASRFLLEYACFNFYFGQSSL